MNTAANCGNVAMTNVAPTEDLVGNKAGADLSPARNSSEGGQSAAEYSRPFEEVGNARMKIHLAYRKANAWGGHTTGSHCHRLNSASQDGMNITDDPKKVTCKFCLKLMAFPQRITRHRL